MSETPICQCVFQICQLNIRYFEDICDGFNYSKKGGYNILWIDAHRWLWSHYGPGTTSPARPSIVKIITDHLLVHIMIFLANDFTSCSQSQSTSGSATFDTILISIMMIIIISISMISITISTMMISIMICTMVIIIISIWMISTIIRITIITISTKISSISTLKLKWQQRCLGRLVQGALMAANHCYDIHCHGRFDDDDDFDAIMMVMTMMMM